MPSLGRRLGTRIVTVRGYSESGAEIEVTPLFARRGVQFAHAPKRVVLSGVTNVAIRQATVVFTDVPLPK
jgi:DNA-directed RNA polymerase alpha subunit